MRAIAIDFETANESRTSACAVGFAWIEDGAVTRRAYRLIRPPEMRFSPGNIRVHGIRPADVEHASDLPTVFAEFWDDLVDRPILAHNAAFDMGVLRGTLALFGRPIPRMRYVCTHAIARLSWPGEASYGLAAMAAKIGVCFQHHHAEEDAYACAQVALAAAGRANTSLISVLVEGLGIRPGEIEGPSYAPCLWARKDAPRERPARRHAPAGRMSFAVAGSTGTRYDIAGRFNGETYTLRCSCTAGRNKIRCRHVTALLDGEVGGLLSDNLFDVEKLRVVVEAIGLEQVRPGAKRARRSQDSWDSAIVIPGRARPEARNPRESPWWGQGSALQAVTH
jgi:DNA polymerase-3 subunit epsilon